MRNWLYVAFIFISGIVNGQDSTVNERVTNHESETDTIGRKMLQEVVVQAYEQNRRLSEAPVAVGVITTAEWNRYSKMSIVPAINRVPGGRMEERSPRS